MNGKRTVVISIALLAMLVTSGWAATLEVSQPVQVTSDSYYERGQSVVYDGSDYWLFYGRSASCTVPYSGGDPDIHDYQIYLSKASTVAGLAAATPVAISGAADSYLGETGAVAYGADVWVFATIDADGAYTPTSDCDLYGWWSADGTSWNQVGPIISGIGDGQAHHDEVVFDGKLWVLDGSGSFTTIYSTTPKTGGWSTPVTVGSLTGGLGHFFVDGTSLYLALGSAGTYYIYVWDGVSSWTLVDSKMISGYYDPTLFKVGSDYVFYCAPYSGGRQWVVGWTAAALDGSFFDGPEMDVIEGQYGSNVWVDMWPIGFTTGGTSYLFYTSERDTPSAEGPGNIWYTEVDWTVSNDHYTYIQEAVDAALTGDVVDVAAGTYVEQVTIDGSLSLTGDGETTTTIQAPAADRAGSVVNGTSTWDYILAAYPASGTIDVKVEGFTLDGNGENKSAGTNGLVGVFMRDVDGVTAGLYSCTIQNFAAVEYESWGVRVYGDADLTLHDNTLSGYTRDGITVNGDDGAGADPVAAVSGNDLTGSGLCLNGIQIGYGAAGTVTGNTVRDHTRSSPWAAVGLFAYESDGVTIGAVGDGNTVQNCFDGIVLLRSDGSSIVGNTLTENIAFHIGIDDSDNNQVSANVLTSSTAIPDKAIGISNGATGNVIGGPTAADGNTITIPTSGGLLYGIYVQSTTGSGSNTVQNNTFAGGTRFVQVDGGNSGTTTVADNTVSNCSFAGVYFNAGSGIITGNTLTNTVRPVEFWGANNVTIENNYVDGAAFDGINAGAFTGTVTVTENAFLSTSGRSLNNRTTTPIDASQNYWGVTTASGVADEIDGDAYVDYTPWLGGGTHDSPGFTGDYSTLFVDDDGAQTGSLGRIEEGLGLVTSTTVNMEAGTYPETVALTTSFDGGTLSGASSGNTFVTGGMTLGAGLTGAAIRDICFTGVGSNNSVIRSLGTVTNLTLDGIAIDGENVAGRLGYSGGQLEGDVTVTDCEMKNVLGWALLDSRSGSGGDGSAMGTVTFANNYVHDCNGSIVFRGLSTDRTDVVNVYGNTFTNIGGNEGAVGQHWAAFEANRAIEVNAYENFIDDVTEGEWGEGQAFQFWNVDTLNCHHNTITNNFQGIWIYGGSTWAIPGGAISYNNISGNTDYGISVDPTATGGPLNAEMNWWGDASGPATSKGTGDKALGNVDYDPWIGKTGGENIVCDADPEYLSVATPTKTVDVNYLGGGGGLMYGYSLVFTWDGAIASTAPGSVTQGTLLSDAGSTFFFPRTTGVNEITVDCMLLGTEPGVTGPGKMFSIAFTGLAVGTSAIDITVDRVRDKDNVTLSGFFEDDGELIVDVSNPTVADVLITNDTLAHTNDYIKNTDQATVTANVSDDDPGFGLANIAADLTGLGGGAAVNPDTYADPVATWTLASVTCVPSDGVVTVTVTATDAMANTANANDTIIADNTAPTAVTNFDAAPGNQQCDLSWTNGTDDYLVGVEVRRYAEPGEYPQYPWFVGNWPVVDAKYPGDELSGAGVYDGTGTSYTDGVVDRNIYYYQAFCYD
ncbi:MAG: right-handed parallel beta-helix repeat-containing protein, partial [Candidatus Eisenbacteria bacterium]